MDGKRVNLQRRRAAMMQLNVGTERDDDLILFRELQKRENERNSSLLLPVSDDAEFDMSGKHLLRIHSGKKESGLEFLGEARKNDYDWLKTPPATPLFPSLEMEPSAQLVTQKEIPITQSLSRFRDDSEATTPNTIDGKANNNNSTKAKVPKRSVTPSHNNRQRQNTVTNIESKTRNDQESRFHRNGSNNFPTKLVASIASNAKAAAVKESSDPDFLTPNNIIQKAKFPLRSVTPSYNRNRPRIVAAIESNKNDQESGMNYDNATGSNNFVANIMDASSQKANTKETSEGYDFLKEKLEKSTRENDQSEKKARNRDLTPSVKSTFAAQMAEFSNEAPSNLRTNPRSTSVNRGRVGGIQNLESAARAGGQMRSSSVTRGAKQPEKSDKNLKIQKDRTSTQLVVGFNENKAHVMGSKMVEKLMNARRVGINQVERETKPKSLKSVNKETSGYGRTSLKNSMVITPRNTVV